MIDDLLLYRNQVVRASSADCQALSNILKLRNDFGWCLTSHPTAFLHMLVLRIRYNLIDLALSSSNAASIGEDRTCSQWPPVMALSCYDERRDCN